MAKSLDIFAEELTCAICLGLFNTPVTIPCGHNFCGKCLEITWETSTLSEFRCPQCMHTFSAKPELRKNTLLSNLVSQLQSVHIESPKPDLMVAEVVEDPCDTDLVLCDSCMKLPAAKTCLTCLASFCEEHLQPHLDSPAFIHHLLKQPLRDLHVRKCQDHDKLLDQYCREHSCCICCYCLSNHKQCHTCTLQEGKMEKERDFCNILKSLNQKIEKASNTTDEVKREQIQVMDIANKKKNLLEGEFKEIIYLIEQEKKKSMRKIEEEEKKVNSKFSYTLSVIGKKKQEFGKMKSSIESLLREEDDLQFLKQASKVQNTISKEPYKPKTEFDEKLLNQIFRNTVSLKETIKAKLQQADDTPELRKSFASTEEIPAGCKNPKQEDTPQPSSSSTSSEKTSAGAKKPKQSEKGDPATIVQHLISPPWIALIEGREEKLSAAQWIVSGITFSEEEQKRSIEKPKAKGPTIPTAPSPDGKNNPQSNTKKGPSITYTREDVLKYAVRLTANPNTAHKRVLISERNTKLLVSDKVQDYQDNPERFTHCSQVLCSQGFCQGIHYWEVDIQGGHFSGFGIAYRSIPRNGAESRLGRNSVSWCLEYFNGKLQAWHNEKETSLNSPNTNRIGVLLNYDEGFISFFSVSKTFGQIYRFRAQFTEAVYPAFWVFSANSVLSFNTFS